MGKISGRLVNLGLGIENTRGTDAGSYEFTPKTSFKIQAKVLKTDDQSSINNIVKTQDSIIVKEWMEGTFEMPLKANGIRKTLMALFGTVSTENVDTGVYEHTFTLANTNQHKSMTVAADDGIQGYVYTLGMLNKFTMKIDPKDYITVSVDIQAQKGTTKTLTPTYLSDYILASKNATVKTALNVAGLDAASEIKIAGLELNIDCNLEDEMKVGSTNPVDFANTEFVISGSIDLVYENETYKDYDFDNQNLAMQIGIIDTNTIIGDTDNPGLVFIFDKVNFQEWTPAYDNGKITRQTLKFKGHVDISTGSAIKAVLTNTSANI